MKRVLALTLAVVTLPMAVWAADLSITLPPDNPYAELKPGRGREIAHVHCSSCHSTDYIVMQPKGDAKQWEAVVKKMINVYGAAVSDAEIQVVVEYLTSAYGPGK